VFNVPGETFEKKALTRFLIKNEADVVLAEMAEIGAAVLPSVRAAQKPLFVYFRGNDPYCNPDIAKVPYPELFQYATGIFVVSKVLQRQLLELGVPKHKLFYNPSGVDISLFNRSDPAQNKIRIIDKFLIRPQGRHYLGKGCSLSNFGQCRLVMSVMNISSAGL